MNGKRASGILLHITSLPCRHGVGDLGPEAYRFADFLARCRQSYWQVLPVNAPAAANSHCPYHVRSAFAGNQFLISPELLHRQGLLTKKETRNIPVLPSAYADFGKVVPYKTGLLNTAYRRFKNRPKVPEYRKFCRENKSWLDDYTLFVALREHFGPGCWTQWPPEFRDRQDHAIESISPQLRETIEQEKFFQYFFFKQWFDLKRYCNQKGVGIIGDIPIYVAHHSADVWAHPEIFKLTRTRKPRAVSGVPPDCFSKTGQLWGHPVYDWDALRDTGYSWWLERIKHNLSLFDVVRIDHFQAFASFWEVPAHHRTATKGKWVSGPGDDFFKKLFKRFPDCPVIVEDLGHDTAAMNALIRKFDLAGMRLLMNAFDGDPKVNPHCLHNHVRNCVVYTGTHDSNTARGWFKTEARSKLKRRLFDYLGRKVHASQLHWELIRLAYSSVADTAIIPMQDILGLAERARMNRPGTTANNWRWRLGRYQISSELAKKLAAITTLHGRA